MKTIQKSKKILASMCAVVLMIGCMAIGAVAASNSQTIQAMLSYDITVKYNNQNQVLKDAAGKTIYPVVYEGSTYLPVRAVAQLTGLPVDWDGNTRTVYLGEKERTPVDANLWKTDASIWCRISATTDKSELVIDGTAYDFGVIMNRFDSFASGGKAGYIKTDGKYSTLSVRALCRDGQSGTLKFYADGTEFKSVELSDGMSQVVDIDIHGANIVNVSWDGNEKGATAVMTDMYLK